jgi:hypothetical protein
MVVVIEYPDDYDNDNDYDYDNDNDSGYDDC